MALVPGWYLSSWMQGRLPDRKRVQDPGLGITSRSELRSCTEPRHRGLLEELGLTGQLEWDLAHGRKGV